MDQHHGGDLARFRDRREALPRVATARFLLKSLKAMSEKIFRGLNGKNLARTAEIDEATN
jgi:hypothetical protein